jgi:hypothetical protein
MSSPVTNLDPPARSWKRAWSPPQSRLYEVTTIPLLPQDQSLPWEEGYLVRLASRIAWMMEEHSRDPSEVATFVDQKFMDRLGRPFPWDSLSRPLAPQLVRSVEVDSLLEQMAGIDQLQFPQSVEAQPRAMSALKETTLDGWLSLLLPPNAD